MLRKCIWVTPKKCGTLFRNHALHTVHIDRLKVCQMAYNLPSRPFSGNRFGIELLFAHAGNRALKKLRSSQVSVDQILMAHNKCSKSFVRRVQSKCTKPLSICQKRDV